jgi:hypothetical protein
MLLMDYPAGRDGKHIASVRRLSALVRAFVGDREYSAPMSETDAFPDDCPTLARDGRVIGFCPSPSGSHLLVWWRSDCVVIGGYETYEAGVAAALRAIAGDGLDPDPDEVKVEAAHLEKSFTATDWMGLGF